EMPRAVLEQRPATVATLRGTNVSGEARLHLRARPLHESIEEDVLRVHRDVRFEWRVPVACGRLQRQKAVLCARDRVRDAGGELGAAAELLAADLSPSRRSTSH